MGQCNAIPDCSAVDDKGNKYNIESDDDDLPPSAANRSPKQKNPWMLPPADEAIKQTQIQENAADAHLGFRSSDPIGSMRLVKVKHEDFHPPPAAVVPKTYEKSPYSARMMTEAAGAGGVPASLAEQPEDAKMRAETGWTLVFRQTAPHCYRRHQFGRNKSAPHLKNFSILDELEKYRGGRPTAL